MSPMIRLAVAVLSLSAASVTLAASPNCATEGGTLLSWPSTNPVWEMCWLPPNSSIGPRGSGLELRAVHYRGIRVAHRIHAPMLFAEYAGGQGGDCYRDWKDESTALLAHTSTHNQLGVPPDLNRLATTSCSVSNHPTASYGSCPFQQPTGGGYQCTIATGVVLEDLGDHVRLVSQYRAGWYMYDSRIRFRDNGVIEPTFGFGNNSGLYNNVTHWHHNYWRFDFGIDDQESHIVSINGVDQSTEFHDLRGAPGDKTWEVRNPTTGRGYQLVPGANDYQSATNESGRNFHTVDFMATRYQANEYGDNSNYSLSDCGMNQNVLVNGQNIHEQDVVFWYRVAVRDSTANNWPPGCGGAGNPCDPQDSMICKSAGPQLVPFGDWGQGGDPEEADLSIAVVSAPEPVDAGATVEFEVSIDNAGPQAVDEAEVSFDLPPELSLALGIQRGGSDWSCDQAGSIVTCELDSGSIAAGAQSTFSITLDVDGDAPDGAVETAASVSSSQWPDPDTANNAVMVTTTIVGSEEADLSIAVMSDPEPVSAGAVVQFHTTIANGGPRPVEQAQVEFDLPPELSLSSVRGATTSWSCQQLGDTVTCDMTTGSIGAKAQTLFIVALDVDKSAPDGKVQTAASVGSSQWPDPDTSNNTVLVSTTIEGLDLDTIFAHDFECREGAPGCP